MPCRAGTEEPAGSFCFLSECSSLRGSLGKDKGLRLFMAKAVYGLYLEENSKSLEGRGSLFVFFFKKANSLKKKK